MAWPKRGTRKLVIDGATWLWHFSGHCCDCSDKAVTVGREGLPHYLFLDTYARDFVETPGHIVASLRWALANGWSPAHGPDRALTAKGTGFEWLPNGMRHWTDTFKGSNAVDLNRL